MNTFLFDLLPVILFFVSFKYYGIYVATIIGILATSFQTLFTRVTKKKWDKMQVITLFIFVIFGGMTLYFHNPIFVKWKPTIVFWVFALILFVSQLMSRKPLIQSILESTMNKQPAMKSQEIPPPVGKKLN